MATSPALAWSLNNGISQQQFDQNIVDAIKQGEAQGLSEAQFESLMNQYQISAADVARATQSTPEAISARMQAATPTTPTEIAYDQTAMAELAAREVQNQAQIAANEKAYQEYLRLNEIKNQQQIAANQKAYQEQQRLNNLAYAEQQRLNNLKNQEQIAANLRASEEQKRLNALKSQEQIATNQKAYEAYLANQAKLAAGQAGGTGPFANATQGFAQNFANYQSIPIGAQYNPNVVGGAGSPYSQIMGQMQPVGNPYAGVVAGQAMGGYNPGLYDQIAAANVARAAAANTGVTLADYYGGGGDANSADAGEGPGGNSGGGEGNGATAGEAGAGYAMGGMVNGLFGMNPPGPDDGAGYLDRGEYVIKKSSVNKYGRGLLDMINEGKVPAKKIKSLLG